MHHASEILLTLFIVFVAAQIGGEIAQRLKLPGVVGEIAAGCVIGPSLLGWITPEQTPPARRWMYWPKSASCCCCFRWAWKPGSRI
jgi:hypothetical protein